MEAAVYYYFPDFPGHGRSGQASKTIRVSFLSKKNNISYCDILFDLKNLISRRAEHQMQARSLSKQDFEALSTFRYQLRKFLRFSEEAAQSEGVTPQQYLLLLHVKGSPGRDWASVGELAERLQSQHHSVVALISRCEKLELVERRSSEIDRRQVNIHLLPAGERCLAKLAELHHAELNTLTDIFRVPTINT
jgi:DNA-binding MarR family transcriptional regulator